MKPTLAEDNVVISGTGQSEIGRRLGRSAASLTAEACLAAIEDAGLTPSDIDGVATFPGFVDDRTGFGPVGVSDVQEALRLKLSWYHGGIESPGQLGSVIAAVAAVAAGYARHVLCFRTVTEGSAQGTRGRASVAAASMPARAGRAPGIDWSWFMPFGAASPANWVAMYAAAHFHEFGTTREQLAQIAITCRANAARNSRAIYREPLSMEDYLGARTISDPLCLYDCDVPCDASTAIIVSAIDAADDLRKPPVRIEAVGTGLRGRNSWDQWEDLTTMSVRDAASMMWSRTALTPSDVDVAELYDGFSFIALAWIEAMGFCGRGEGGPFIEGGGRISVNGSLPMNTHGGQLSAGRSHGYGMVHEACLQLWGEADDHQLAGLPEVAVASAGGGPLAGCMLLTRW